MEEENVHQDNVAPCVMQSPYSGSFGPVLFSKQVENLSGNQTAKFAGQVNDAPSMLSDSVSALPLIKSPAPSTSVDNNKTFSMDDPMLSLNLSLSSGHHDQLSSRHPVYQVARNFSIGDSMISVV